MSRIVSKKKRVQTVVSCGKNTSEVGMKIEMNERAVERTSDVKDAMKECVKTAVVKTNGPSRHARKKVKLKLR